MTLIPPAEAASLIAWAKRKAMPVHSCVTASLRPDHLIGEAGVNELKALVIVLAEAVDPVKLRAVVNAADEPVRIDRAEMLRRAHADATALRKAGQKVTGRLAILDREYERDKRRRSRAGERRAA